MKAQKLEAIANALVADGKGILAADETVGTLTKRFEGLKIRSTPQSILHEAHLPWLHRICQQPQQRCTLPAGSKQFELPEHRHAFSDDD
jgi:hypothetical protein